MNFNIGQRVAATRYGVLQHGTVTRMAQGVRTRLTDGVIVWVRWDGHRRETWMHGTSLLEHATVV
jgi:hypothetical protein